MAAGSLGSSGSMSYKTLSMKKNCQFLSSVHVEVSRISLTWRSPSGVWLLQGWILSSTSHKFGRVLSLFLQLEKSKKWEETSMHLCIHSVGAVHGWCKSFWTSQPCWWSCYGKVLNFHVELCTILGPNRGGFLWILWWIQGTCHRLPLGKAWLNFGRRCILYCQSIF